MTQELTNSSYWCYTQPHTSINPKLRRHILTCPQGSPEQTHAPPRTGQHRRRWPLSPSRVRRLPARRTATPPGPRISRLPQGPGRAGPASAHSARGLPPARPTWGRYPSGGRARPTDRPLAGAGGSGTPLTPRPVPAPARRWEGVGGKQRGRRGKGKTRHRRGGWRGCGGTHCRTTVSPKRTIARPRTYGPDLPAASCPHCGAPRPPLTSWPRPLPSRGGGNGRQRQSVPCGAVPGAKGSAACRSPTQPKQKELPNLFAAGGLLGKLRCFRSRVLVVTSRRCSATCPLSQGMALSLLLHDTRSAPALVALMFGRGSGERCEFGLRSVEGSVRRGTGALWGCGCGQRAHQPRKPRYLQSSFLKAKGQMCPFCSGFLRFLRHMLLLYN